MHAAQNHEQMTMMIQILARGFSIYGDGPLDKVRHNGNIEIPKGLTAAELASASC